MKHYRVNKVARVGGNVIKRKDILAANDGEAVERARHDEDCPVCEVWREGKPVAAIVQN
ncbi:MAG TPA: hypothetical protein VM055_06310 [Novosphingobium sp.]|nr:hypothetical protein [Novosphingobium sp.]